MQREGGGRNGMMGGEVCRGRGGGGGGMQWEGGERSRVCSTEWQGSTCGSRVSHASSDGACTMHMQSHTEAGRHCQTFAHMLKGNPARGPS